MLDWLNRFLPGRPTAMPPRRGLRALFGALAFAAAAFACSAGAALAQASNCSALQSQIAAASRPTQQSEAYQRAAERQARELAKMQGYAATMGCDRRQFLFFGDPPPPQCNALIQRIAAMQANLNRLRMAAQGGNEDRRRALVARYDAFCRNNVAAIRPRNFFEQLFGGGPDVREEPIGPPVGEPGEDGEFDDSISRGGSMAVCVRKCDGGFFPVSYSASRRNIDDLADLCSALCPNAETVLFTKRPHAEIDETVSIHGASYSSLANAGKFKARFDPSCTCKPPHQSWVQALARAEKLLANKSQRDLIVTAEKAEELSRPKAIKSAVSGKNAGKNAGKQPPASKSASELREERDAARLEREGRDEAAAADAANAGIAPGRATAQRRYTVNDGKRETVTLSDGEKKTIRVIGPQM